jgi:hypothetical protein
VAEQADAHGSGPCARKGVGVQLPPRAPIDNHVRPGRRRVTLPSSARIRVCDTPVILRRVAHGEPPYTRAPNLAAASACIPGITCAYTPRVMIGEACPRRSETTFTGTPDANRIDACVCLRSRLCRRRHNHDLRHTHVAWLVAGGAPLPHIQARLGHESITTTIDTYGHLLPAG